VLDHAKLKDFAPGEGVAAGAYRAEFDEDGWIEVPVPGDVHRTLTEAGRIEDPFYDRNEGGYAWITRFSDNYFDLETGEERTISVTNAKRSPKPEMVEVRWR